MKIAITGATGFIGKNFINQINECENEYICIVRKSSNIKNELNKSNVEKKIIDFEQEQELVGGLKDVDVVIHMVGKMGEYGTPYEEYEKINCILTRKIVQACVKKSVKQFIYLSTPGVQGFGNRLAVEEEKYAPRNQYEITKVKAEEIIIDELADTEVKYTIIRPDFVYGPEDYRRIKMYKNIRDKKFVLTTSGKSYLHPTHVYDVVQGINCCIANPNAHNQIFNISAENDITVEKYLNIIAEYFNTRIIKINIGYKLSCIFAFLIEKACNILLKRDGFVSKNKIDFLSLDHSTSCEKAKMLLGYSPQYDFKNGFKNTMNWIEENNLL